MYVTTTPSKKKRKYNNRTFQRLSDEVVFIVDIITDMMFLASDILALRRVPQNTFKWQLQIYHQITNNSDKELSEYTGVSRVC